MITDRVFRSADPGIEVVIYADGGVSVEADILTDLNPVAILEEARDVIAAAEDYLIAARPKR